MDVGLDRVVVDRAGGVDAGLEDQVGEGEDDCGVLVWEAGLGSRSRKLLVSSRSRATTAGRAAMV